MFQTGRPFKLCFCNFVITAQFKFVDQHKMLDFFYTSFDLFPRNELFFQKGPFTNSRGQQNSYTEKMAKFKKIIF